MRQKVATKEHKRSARGLIEALESRIHCGPPIVAQEIAQAAAFLRQNDFSPASDYYDRLTQIQRRITERLTQQPARATDKRNYGGEAGGRWMQVQSVYDHLILSTCYAGEFNTKRGRIKISHRFNSEGRIEFVELKFLRSLLPCLTGETRKLLLVKEARQLSKSWYETEAFTLRVLPQELIFLHAEIFRCNKPETLAWLMNIGHWLLEDLATELRAGSLRPGDEESDRANTQRPLAELRDDAVAQPILEKAATLEAAVDSIDDQSVILRYHRV